jgi:plastocyanin
MGALIWLVGLAFAQGRDEIGPCLDVGTLYEPVPAEQSGLRALGNGLGANVNDFDGDGDLDVFAAMGPATAEGGRYYAGPDLLYLNDGDLTFTEGGFAAGVDDPCEDRAPMFGDLDNDGIADLYVTVNGTNVYYRGLGNGRYEDSTAKAGGAGHVGWGHQGFLFDYDRDGWLDVFFTNGPEDGSGFNALLHNQRDGTFRDATWDAGVAGSPSGKGSCVLDANGDNWPDVFVTTGREYGNQLFVNRGDGTFEDEALERGLSDPFQRFGVGAVCGDLDNDGDDDVMLVTHDKKWTGNQLFENRAGQFADRGEAAGLVGYEDGHGQALADVDNDGLLDLVLSGIRSSPYVFLNQGGLEFERVCNGAGVDQEEGITWAVVAGDMTYDGYPEIYISNGLGRRPRDGQLFRHVGDVNHWLTLDVRGGIRNPSAIGARVQVVVGETTVTRTVGGWSSFDSQGPLAVTVGLGEATVADQVRVVYPDGTSVVLEQVAADQAIVVEPEEPDDADRDGVPDGWDACPGTRVGERHDAEGCGIGQRRGVAVGLVSPVEDAVFADAPTFTWEGGAAQGVLQISLDGTFGPAGRLDFGPITASEYTPSAQEWAAIVAESDGTRALLWRVAAIGEDGGEAITPPRRLHVAVPADVVHVPLGASVFLPAHIAVSVGDTVTWWNDSVSGGNLQNEPHDVQLVDPHGVPRTSMFELNGAGYFSYTFDEPGQWFYLCHRHSGDGTGDPDGSETRHHIHREGPYRCMSGTVVVR